MCVPFSLFILMSSPTLRLFFSLLTWLLLHTITMLAVFPTSSWGPRYQVPERRQRCLLKRKFEKAICTTGAHFYRKHFGCSSYSFYGWFHKPLGIIHTYSIDLYISKSDLYQGKLGNCHTISINTERQRWVWHLYGQLHRLRERQLGHCRRHGIGLLFVFFPCSLWRLRSLQSDLLLIMSITTICLPTDDILKHKQIEMRFTRGHSA